jgi:predicted permease
MTSSLTVEGYQAGDREEVTASRNVVSAGYFDAMGIPFVLGRAFQEQDRAGGPRVAVVNEAFVQRYCRGQNPLGRKISFDNRADSLDIEIVGVVKNQKNASLREKTKHFVYTPYTQEDDVPSLSFYVWCRRDEAALGPDVRRVVRELDAHLPVSQMQTVRARREEMLRPERTVALLACGFAAIAAVLAAVGLYGLLAYGVLRRTREIGIRMALGAPRAQVFRLIFQEALTCLGVGLVLGVPLALSLGRYLESQLFGLQAGDLTVVSGAAAILGLTVSVAAFVPARRAARINPMAALRWE